MEIHTSFISYKNLCHNTISEQYIPINVKHRIPLEVLTHVTLLNLLFLKEDNACTFKQYTVEGDKFGIIIDVDRSLTICTRNKKLKI